MVVVVHSEYRYLGGSLVAVVLTIENPKDLNRAVDLVHDRWFSTNDIVFDKANESVLIRFAGRASSDQSGTARRWFSKVRKPLLVEWLLRIGNVEKYSIDDKAGIEKYDFNELIYDQRARTVTITSGLPFQMVIAVKEFAISVEETTNFLAERNKPRPSGLQTD